MGPTLRILPLIKLQEQSILLRLNKETKPMVSTIPILSYSNNFQTDLFKFHTVGTLTGTSTPGQSGTWSNGTESVFHIFQSSRTETLLLDAV